MHETIKILLADDSAVVRQMLKETLNAEPDLHVTQAVINGRAAVEQLKSEAVDVVVLDIEMPEMNGLQATEAIRSFNKDVPIVIFSSLTTAGGQATLQALMAGATDCVAKPSNTGSLQEAIQHIQGELIPMIRSLGSVSNGSHDVGSEQRVSGGDSASPLPRREVEKNPFDVVTIGVSTGGPNALSRLFSLMPASFPLPIVIVQHMPAKFTHLLAQRLDSECDLTVIEAEHGQPAVANHVYIAPGGQHLRISGRGSDLTLTLDDGLLVNSCRPSVDVLFHSAAMCGNRVLATMLTGMGCDGLDGSRDVKQAGGHIIAQDEATSAVWGMPGEVVKQGLADQVLPLDQIAGELVRLVPHQQPSRCEMFV